MKWFTILAIIAFLALFASAAEEAKTDSLASSSSDAVKATGSANPDKAREDRAARRKVRVFFTCMFDIKTFIPQNHNKKY